MSTRVSILNPLADPDWDARLAYFPNATIFHTAAWARVLHETYGHRPMYLALVEPESQLSGHKSQVPADSRPPTFDLRPSTPQETLPPDLCTLTSASTRSDLRPSDLPLATAPQAPTVLLPLMEISSPLTGRRGISLPFTDAVEPLFASDPTVPFVTPRPAPCALRPSTRDAERTSAAAEPSEVPTSVGNLRPSTLDLRPSPSSPLPHASAEETPPPSSSSQLPSLAPSAPISSPLPLPSSPLPLAATCDLGPATRNCAARFRLLYDELLHYAKSHRWRYLELRGGARFFPEAPAEPAFFRHTLDLTRGDEALFAGCESSVRRAVRKAEKSGIAITRETSPEAVRTFFDLYCLTRKKHGQPPQPYSFFGNIQRHILAKGHGCIFLAHAPSNEPSKNVRTSDLPPATGDRPPMIRGAAAGPAPCHLRPLTGGAAGIPTAALMFFWHGQTAIYKFGASDDRFQHLRANNLLMWEAIQHFARAGLRTLDFGRTSLGNEGLRKYKLGWGTVEHPVRYTKYDLRRSEVMPYVDNSHGWHTKVFARLPIWALRLAGSLLYRHIA